MKGKNILTSKYMVLGIILMIQVLGMIYWGYRKSNFYLDELYSFESAHYCASTTPERTRLFISELFEKNLDKWMPVSVYKATYTVTDASSVMNDSFGYTIKNFFRSTNAYMILLNLSETLWFQGKISKWSGIILNLIGAQGLGGA